VHALLELGDRDTHLDEIARAVFCVAAPVIVIVVSRPDETSQVCFKGTRRTEASELRSAKIRRGFAALSFLVSSTLLFSFFATCTKVCMSAA